MDFIYLLVDISNGENQELASQADQLLAQLPDPALLEKDEGYQEL